jgi:Na+-transporting methylmalonyl-CoA/oxaloacetate decarboxylase gamma subunit
MPENLSNALFITLIGMGLVFLSLLLLWAAMALMMRLAVAKSEPQEPNYEQTSLSELRKRAAIAAVVVAMTRDAEEVLHEFPLPPTAFVSAWQAVMRSNMFKKRGNVR